MKGLYKTAQLAQGAFYADRTGAVKYIPNSELSKTEKTRNTKTGIMEEQPNFDSVALMNSSPVDSIPQQAVNVGAIIKQVTENVMQALQPFLIASEETKEEPKTKEKPAKNRSKKGGKSGATLDTLS